MPHVCTLHAQAPKDSGKGSVRHSVFNLVNCILGAGILGYPYCFKNSGFALATCVMIVCMGACRFSYQLLLWSTQLTSKRTYEELAEQAVGRIGRNMVSLCTAAVNLGSIVAYLNILAGEGCCVPVQAVQKVHPRHASRAGTVESHA